jgi:hypothetical protein
MPGGTRLRTEDTAAAASATAPPPSDPAATHALLAVGAPDWSPHYYDGLWAAQTIWRIARNRPGLDSLLEPIPDAPPIASRIEEIGRQRWGLLCFA